MPNCVKKDNYLPNSQSSDISLQKEPFPASKCFSILFPPSPIAMIHGHTRSTGYRAISFGKARHSIDNERVQRMPSSGAPNRRHGAHQLAPVGSVFTSCSSSLDGTKGPRVRDRFERKKFPWLVERGRASRTTKGQVATCARMPGAPRLLLRPPPFFSSYRDQFRGNVQVKRQTHVPRVTCASGPHLRPTVPDILESAGNSRPPDSIFPWIPCNPNGLLPVILATSLHAFSSRGPSR